MKTNTNLKWQKVRSGLYFTKYKNDILSLVKIEAQNVDTTGWFAIEIYDNNGGFIEQLEAYPTLKQGKLAILEIYNAWKRA